MKQKEKHLYLRLVSSHFSTCGCEAVVFILPPFLLSSLPPSFSWCQVALCLLLLSISFHLWALQLQPIPLSRILKEGAELSVENLQTLSQTHLIVHTYSCISLSGFLIRPPSFVYSGWCKLLWLSKKGLARSLSASLLLYRVPITYSLHTAIVCSRMQCAQWMDYAISHISCSLGTRLWFLFENKKWIAPLKVVQQVRRRDNSLAFHHV